MNEVEQRLFRNQGRIRWHKEVERRGIHLEYLSKMEAIDPDPSHPWRSKLIIRARFTHFLDQRNIAISRAGVKNDPEV